MIRASEHPTPGEHKNTFQVLRAHARLQATPHMEALAALRYQERKSAR
jgi:hypothetical protein